ncbi:Alpha/beta hydrolase family protein [Enhygromyxa salina]|uniref:Alpha/beta hydrolase family protein n=1 Tax=Enhygromyxa salina TaxID=215803 RepID=A0A2S9YFN4_9BACT|nr:alpha/beta hydrolase family protein [Enhygromyxa salina]PRQ03851.1 Alpha/beta hydrolase family protein [Enhygromyxa salina]
MSQARESSKLPVVSMHAPPAVPEQLVAFATRAADKILLAALRRLFLGNDVPTSEASFRSVVDRLQRYVDPELLADPERLLGLPPKLPKLRVVQRQPLTRLRREVGIDEHLCFATPYQPCDPEYASEYASYPEIATGHMWSWRHLDPAPATILLTHGWGVGPWWMHRYEYDVPYLFHELGLDVYFYLAPFHGRRTPSQARLGGQLHPSADLVRTNEAFIQTAIELRTLISAILARNEAPVGMMGSSLGGYTSALMASIDERLDFVIPVLAPASMAHLLWDHAGDDPLHQRALRLGMTRERFHHFWSLHSPLTHRPKVPWGRRMIVTGLGDTLVTADHTRDLWEHWDRPRHFRFPGGHAWQLQSKRYHREVGRFLRDIGVVTPRAVACARP